RNSTNSRYFATCSPYTRAIPSDTATTVPTLAISVSLPPKSAMFFSMMALISSAQDAIVIPPRFQSALLKLLNVIFSAQPFLLVDYSLSLPVNQPPLRADRLLLQTENRCCCSRYLPITAVATRSSDSGRCRRLCDRRHGQLLHQEFRAAPSFLRVSSYLFYVPVPA